MTVTMGSQPNTYKLKPWAFLLIMVLPLFIIMGLDLALLEANRTQVSSGPAPDFTLRLYDGHSFTLSEQRGKVMVINFWASWYGPCRIEAPELNAIWDEYKDKDVVMVGIDYLNNETDARAFLVEFDVRYLNSFDMQSQIANTYRIKGVPETYIVDRQGNLVMTIPAPTTANALRSILDRLLSGLDEVIR